MSIHFPPPRVPVAQAALDLAVTSTAVATPGLGNLRLSRFTQMQSVKPLWQRLEATAVCSPYQRFSWVNGWLETLGNAARVTPDVVVVSRDGEPLALFPLAIHRRGPFRILAWMSDSHTNFNMPVMAKPFLADATGADIDVILGQLPALVPGCDVLDLSCQPECWSGFANPMTASHAVPSYNHAYALDLSGGFDAALGRVNRGRKRKKFRWQTNKLEQVGGGALLVAGTPEDCTRILDAAFAQMAVRFSLNGIANTFESAAAQTFFRKAALRSLSQTEPELRLFALEIDGRIRATFAATIKAGQMSGCFLSIADDEWKPVSPGEMLLYLVVEHAADEGLSRFDLGRGEERYKTSWCPETITLFDCVKPLSRRAVVLALYERAKLNAKRAIKSNDALWSLAKRMRARLFGKT